MAFRCPEPWGLPFGMGSFTDGDLYIRETREQNHVPSEGRKKVLDRCFATDAEKVDKYQGLIVGLLVLHPAGSELHSSGELILPSRQFRELLACSLKGFCPNHARLDFLSHEPIKSGSADPFFVVIDAVFNTTLSRSIGNR